MGTISRENDTGRAFRGLDRFYEQMLAIEMARECLS